MACFVVHLIVANFLWCPAGYILWLVSQVSMFNFLVSAVSVVCFIMEVAVFINYFRFRFSEILAFVYFVNLIANHFRYKQQCINYRITNGSF